MMDILIIPGCCSNLGKYSAHIMDGNISIKSLGVFETKEEAVTEAEKELKLYEDGTQTV